MTAVVDATDAWEQHHREWRDPGDVVAHWEGLGAVEPGLLRSRVRGDWWGVLDRLGVTLVVTREYEHLVVALGTVAGRPHVTCLRLPHPSGLAVDAGRGVVHVASTRNPNQVLDLEPVRSLEERLDSPTPLPEESPLVPVRARFYPGSLYLHDLAFVDGRLHANAVGQNAVVALDERGGYERVWWPRCIETPGGPEFRRNHIQLNSIAAGPTLADSFFSASLDRLARRRPGHRDFPVDRRGVIFDGATREPVVRGLTRPHSARLHEGRLWVDNSGYGEVGVVVDGRFVPVARPGGWTRGLCFAGGVAFVGTSRVIPRFRRYAPGLEGLQSVCGVHAIDVATGSVVASVVWPRGNQVFAIEALPSAVSTGLPFTAARRPARARALFYRFSTAAKGDDER